MRRQKLIERIQNNPENVTPDELCRLLEIMGYTRRVRKARGSHHFIFSRPGSPPFYFPHPHPGKEVKRCYVERALRILGLEVADHVEDEDE